MAELDRTRRVAELIRRELSTLLARDLNDHRVRMVSITAVTISRDLKHATVYVSALDATATAATTKPPREREVVAALNNASKYLRRLLSRELNMRTTPSLRFEYDHGLHRAMALGALIDNLNQPPLKQNDAAAKN